MSFLFLFLGGHSRCVVNYEFSYFKTQETLLKVKGSLFGLPIADYEVNATGLKDPLRFLEHACHVDKRVVATKQCVDGRLVNKDVK